MNLLERLLGMRLRRVVGTWSLVGLFSSSLAREVRRGPEGAVVLKTRAGPEGAVVLKTAPNIKLSKYQLLITRVLARKVPLRTR